ncbi:MAG: polysaccharide biosynthesis/export family protein [Sandarakinorhabdus sp.]|nr:polysaccharide biosynthesis/export family protein [Sandarakinorhabdus sp.]
MALTLVGKPRPVALLMLAFALMISFVAVGSGAARAQEAPGYVLGADDTVQVVVYGQTEFNITTRIKSDGTIVMPLIGAVKASGQTNIGLAKTISDSLEKGGLLKSPIVNVEILNYLSKSVNVAGKVTTPGILPLDRPYRALEALLKTGWMRDAGASYVYLRRSGQAEVRLDVDELVRGGPEKDPLLRPGDTLFVPDADLAFLTGQVTRPGSFAITPNMTIRQALAGAGGVTASGSANKLGLIRGNAKEIDVDSAQLVQKNDVIVVKERLF